MKHIFDFYVKHPEVEYPLYNSIITDSNRHSKVARQIVREVNKLRQKDGLEPWLDKDCDIGLKRLR